MFSCWLWGLSSSRKLTEHETIESLAQNIENCKLGRCLVKISTTWLVEGMYWISRFLLRTLSRLNWRFISMCFEWAWKTELAARATALLLSHQLKGGITSGMQSSFKRDWTCVILAVRDWGRAQYSDSALLRETTFYFVKDHEIRLGPRNK